MPGAQCTHSLACEMGNKHTSNSPQVHRDHPAFPHAMVLTAYFVLSPVSEFVLSPSSADFRFCQTRSGRLNLRKFNTSNGCQDHTALPSATIVVRQRAVNRSRGSTRPAITLRARRCRVHRIPPRVRDDRDTPLQGSETAGDIGVIWVRREQEYFWKWRWTGQIRLIRFSNFAVSRISPRELL